MKIVSSEEMANLEKCAYQAGCDEETFMENAGVAVAHFVHQSIQSNQYSDPIWIVCGKGNNAGDAFVAGRHLIEQGYTVIAYQPVCLTDCSPLCKKNGMRFLQTGGKILNDSFLFGVKGLILDGLFGTGFKGKIESPYADLVEKANQSGLPIFAIDIASGLNGTTGEWNEPTIKASHTLFLSLPKLGLFLQNGWNVTGKLIALDFGLPKTSLVQAPSFLELFTSEQATHLLPPIKRNRHKYQAGVTVGLAGSYKYPGAALLSSLAAFRGGSGMVYLLHPEGMETSLSQSPYELIKIPYREDQLALQFDLLQKASACFIGPGLDDNERTKQLLQTFFAHIDKPIVIDAEALRFLADGTCVYPKKAILTPHRGEMQRLLQLDKPLVNDLETLKMCQQFVEKHQVTLVLKGAPTFIFHPYLPISVNQTGDPGMATAGCGDVLTGLLAALLSQRMTCYDAARLGVYLHGLAGEIAVKKRGTSYGLMASDVIEQLNQAYEACARKS